mmetsp:Transcript_3183/g.5379  ORF Transcript_3183/g.5379 Transcript_3183/m.5379 type:complete len:213 (+) Transcript_3183:207-845(+)
MCRSIASTFVPTRESWTTIPAYLPELLLLSGGTTNQRSTVISKSSRRCDPPGVPNSSFSFLPPHGKKFSRRRLGAQKLTLQKPGSKSISVKPNECRRSQRKRWNWHTSCLSLRYESSNDLLEEPTNTKKKRNFGSMLTREQCKKKQPRTSTRKRKRKRKQSQSHFPTCRTCQRAKQTRPTWRSYKICSTKKKKKKKGDVRLLLLLQKRIYYL